MTLLADGTQPVLPCQVLDLGRLEYEAAYARQKACVAAVTDGAADTLIFVEHDPVITRGRKSKDDENLLAAGETPVVAVERGGDVTWHGPGQLVAYPIFALRDGERDAPRFIRRLEGWLIAALAELGVPDADRRPGYAGVWVQGQKVASVGIAVTARWISWHGVALNVDPDLREFGRINPCGLDASVMTSVAALTGRPASLDSAKRALIAALPAALDRVTEPV